MSKIPSTDFLMLTSPNAISICTLYTTNYISYSWSRNLDILKIPSGLQNQALIGSNLYIEFFA